MPGRVTAAVARPASVALPAASSRGLQRSLSIKVADTSVPATKPSWTAMVSHAWAGADAFHSSAMKPLTTVAANHGIMTKSIAAARMLSCEAGAVWRDTPGRYQEKQSARLGRGARPDSNYAFSL